MNREPIFIVGIQRSGTTLLSAMLASHSHISCGPETHFFQRLSRENIDQITNPISWPHKALEFIKSITYTNYNDPKSGRISIYEKYHLNDEKLWEYLINQKPGIESLLNSILEPYMQSLKKIRWAEKTPDHIKHVNLIRAYFPKSPIIRIIRDPRDVALSLLNVPWGAKNYYEAIDYCKSLLYQSRDFFDNDKLSYTLRYEDLVEQPEVELKKLCDFIDEKFEDSMLDTSTSGKQVNSQNVLWKKKVQEPVDKNRAYNWKNHLDRKSNIYTEAILGDILKQFDYTTNEYFPYFGKFYPSNSHLHTYSQKIIMVFENGIRFWGNTLSENPVATILLGEPMHVMTFENNLVGRLKNILFVLYEVIKTKIKKNKLYWITGENSKSFDGIGNKLLSIVLRPFQYQK
jgi:hypothetical protein